MFKILHSAGEQKLKITADDIREVFTDSCIGLKYLMSGDQDVVFIGEHAPIDLLLEGKSEEELLIKFLENVINQFQINFNDISLHEFVITNCNENKKLAMVLEASKMDITKFYPLNEIKRVFVDEFDASGEEKGYNLTLSFGI